MSSNNPSTPNTGAFTRAFLPGLIVGLVVGGFAGALLSGLGGPGNVKAVGGSSDTGFMPGGVYRGSERDERVRDGIDDAATPADSLEPGREPETPGPAGGEGDKPVDSGSGKEDEPQRSSVMVPPAADGVVAAARPDHTGPDPRFIDPK